LTDPSYKGQIINMTYPLIGNYGVSEIDNQSGGIHAFGFVTRDITFRPSNRCSVMSIGEWLEKERVPGVYNVDTRSIAKKIRTEGTVKCVISNEGISKEEAIERLETIPLRVDYMKDVGTQKLKVFQGAKEAGQMMGTSLCNPGTKDGKPVGAGLRIAILDLGIKRNILTDILARGFEVYLYPYGTTADEILECAPDGVFLSNGPGDPEACTAGIETMKNLIGKIPIFGICMGHQVIGLAFGGKTYKLKFGHRGANHGVIDLTTDRSVITSQNHSFAVDMDSVKDSGLTVTHVNLNDGTVEGMKHESLPIFSVQYHPEGSPGPNDSSYLFDRFAKMITDCKAGTWKGGCASA